MCGRFQFNLSAELTREVFGVEALPPIKPRWNVAPGQEILAVREEPQFGRVGVPVRWGLVPASAWAKDAKIGYKMINARSETAAEKPAFRAAMRYRRCIVPASGFYEWRKQEGSRPKWPFLFEAANREPLALAGLWETWEDRETGEILETAALLTTAANAEMAPVHDRMPVLLMRQDFERWLDPSVNDKPGGVRELATDLLKPAINGTLRCTPVSALVNSPRNEGPEVAHRQDPPPEQQGLIF